MSRAQTLDRRSLLCVLAATTGLLTPHLLRLPILLSGGIVAVLLWRLWAGIRGIRLPGRVVRLLLTLAGLAAVALHYGTVVGPEAGAALLALMAALKLLELRGRRDLRVVVYLSYFLAVTQFIFSQSPAMAFYLLLGCWATTTLLVAANRPTGNGLGRQEARTAAMLMLQAMPVMVILFILFPRLPGPLWALPDQGLSAVTGLDNEMFWSSRSGHSFTPQRPVAAPSE